MISTEPDLFRRSSESPLMVAVGVGVDSTALLVGLAEQGIRPDALLFADVGAEKPETYAYKEEVLIPWLAAVGFPPLITVRYQPQKFKNWPPYHTIEENLLTNSTLPSIVFRRNKSCSQKWKISPQDKWAKEWEPALAAWSSGMKVRKMIGYDASPGDIRRRKLAAAHEDPLFDYEYPLIAQGWEREKCKEVITAAGLAVPIKSACYFCPSSRPEEIELLSPDLLRRIVVIEARSKDKMRKVEGLWGYSTKKRPGSMTQFIRGKRLLDADEIDAIQAATPTQPLFAGDIDNWQHFLSSSCSGCSGCTAA